MASESSDDDLLNMDDSEGNFGDFMMLHCFAAHKGSTIGRIPCRTSLLTGKMYVLEILNGHPEVCYRNFRMQKHVFMNFCDTLKEKGLLYDGKKVSVEEGVAMFLMIVGHTTQYSIIGDRAVCSFGIELIRPTNQDIVHERILQKYPFFKNCIGAIDGTHVAAWAPASRQISFRGRKTNVTQNVMLTCDFDMKFTFVYSGWEGTANDSRVFVDAVTRSSNNFPMPRGDQFYLVDSGYPNMPGFLAPYRGQRYHLRDYVGRGRLRGKEELFNYRHSSCRNIIERCIGVLKARFPILKLITNYQLSRQRQIPTACCAINNFIRQEHALDKLFVQYSEENMVFQDIPESSQDQEVINFDASQTAQMGQVRDQIATQMWNDYSRRRI
ncbi:protein ALP1-like [Olea europaea var. sylvestris]|uniref:protein ALP1-like n=1 Tax=Olea europaea var. sylvestris TaxID=158386 RepID=UPI000C1CF025|nr:protein ALP1-like [Olea europaea var. sylvestris]